jgi:hypothetical protein
MKTLKPNEQRSKNAITLIWIVLTVEIIACISNYFQVNLLQSVLNGGFISDADADSNDTRQQLIAILFLIVYITSAVTFIQWFRRAYFNLHILVKGLSNTEGWAAGAWFVPIVSLFKPYQIMSEMSEKTKALISKNDLASEPIKTSSNTIGLWWALFIINNISGQISFRLPMDTVEEMIFSTNLDVYNILIEIPLAIITVKLIKEHASREALLVNLPIEKEEEHFASRS